MGSLGERAGELDDTVNARVADTLTPLPSFNQALGSIAASASTSLSNMHNLPSASQSLLCVPHLNPDSRSSSHTSQVSESGLSRTSSINSQLSETTQSMILSLTQGISPSVSRSSSSIEISPSSSSISPNATLSAMSQQSNSHQNPLHNVQRDAFGVRRFTRIFFSRHSASECLAKLTALFSQQKIDFRVDPSRAKIFVSWSPTSSLDTNRRLLASQRQGNSMTIPSMICTITVSEEQPSLPDIESGLQISGELDNNGVEHCNINISNNSNNIPVMKGAFADFQRVRGDYVAFHEFFMYVSQLMRRPRV